MRIAELLMAIVMACLSAYLMWKSSELPIGWIPDEGPGGGAWPFWLSAIMLVCCLVTIYRWSRRIGPIASSELVYMEPKVITDVGLVAISLIVTVALFYFIGVYGALPLFIIFYLKIMGNHSWKLTALVSILVPVTTFLFFEIALKITLPKGYTEPAFYPIYKLLL